MAEDVRHRITDFTEAQSMADDDYLLIDGETNNTRKINYENLVGGVQAEIEEDIDDLRASLNEKADQTGSYETLTAGNAEQLVAHTYTEEKAPYLFRASRSVGDRLREKIVGGTIGWNQLCNGSSVTVQSGHKYYMVKNGARSIGASSGSAITGLTSGKDIVTDLTLMLGSTIADYVYTLESSTAGSGVAWLKSNGFFTRDYYAYDAGSLQSVKAGSKINTGFNQWDEEWRNGFYDGSTGAYSANANYVANKNPIHVIGGTEYYFNIPTGKEWCAFWYDANNTFISRSGLYASNPAALTAPSNAAWLNFYLNQNYGTTYKNDICINISDPARNGEYEPYVQHVYPLDTSLTLMGVPKLSGSVMYFDGDEYADDGTVTRRYGIVDLGTLTYSRTSSGLFLTAITASALGDGQVIGDIKANGYTTMPSSGITGPNGANPSPNMVCALASNAVNVYFNNLSYTDAAAFKTAMNGVMLVYKLATPTTAEADPYTNPQIVDEWGTEQFTDYAFEAGTRDIPVPVGHLSKYYPNLRRRIESLPDDFSTLIAPTEAIYKATRNYTSGSLFIVNNILYKATAAIANGGTITPGTNCTSTTLAAVIAAL